MVIPNYRTGILRTPASILENHIRIEPERKDVAESLARQHGIEVDKRKLTLKEQIKSYGDYEAEIKLYTEVSATLKIKVTEA